MNEQTTDMGTKLVSWVDREHQNCVLAESVIKSEVWLGNVSSGGSMKLDRNQVAALIERLQHWLNTGSLHLPVTEPWVSESTAALAAGYALIPDLEEGD